MACWRAWPPLGPWRFLIRARGDDRLNAKLVYLAALVTIPAGHGVHRDRRPAAGPAAAEKPGLRRAHCERCVARVELRDALFPAPKPRAARVVVDVPEHRLHAAVFAVVT